MNTFPLSMDKHIVFCVIGFVFFMVQFFRQGFKYQLLSAFAIAATLLLYLNDSTVWRNIIGVAELILIILIFVIMSVEKKKAEQNAASAQTAEVTAEATAESGEAAAETAETESESAELSEGKKSDGDTENE